MELQGKVDKIWAHAAHVLEWIEKAINQADNEWQDPLSAGGRRNFHRVTHEASSNAQGECRNVMALATDVLRRRPRPWGYVDQYDREAITALSEGIGPLFTVCEELVRRLRIMAQVLDKDGGTKWREIDAKLYKSQTLWKVHQMMNLSRKMIDAVDRMEDYHPDGRCNKVDFNDPEDSDPDDDVPTTRRIILS